ncbi:hypothetical protein B0T14DRAFT_519907 [Immersiella caudata]|uniref:Uncharacterized protein n=1 Tax=Immersiella caudata TaxID=314043 RepID=A0AA39WR30_9PEZI|nr:hypothetical protein B0T14DRAFT_519907 [Immersiella caudata]
MFSRGLHPSQAAVLRCSQPWTPAQPHLPLISKVAFSSTPSNCRRGPPKGARLRQWLEGDEIKHKPLQQKRKQQKSMELKPNNDAFYDYPIGVPRELRAWIQSDTSAPPNDLTIEPLLPDAPLEPPSSTPSFDSNPESQSQSKSKSQSKLFRILTPRKIPSPIPGSHPSTTQEPAGPRHILILSGASPTLTYSDFSRIASQGTLLDGWVQGLDHVHRATDPRTGAPRGHYFLFFDTLASARAYESTLTTLHATSSPHFTLLPPGLPLHVKILPLEQVFAMFRILRGPTGAPAGPSTFYSHLQFLMDPRMSEGGMRYPRVLVTLHGGSLSKAQMFTAVKDALAKRAGFRKRLVGITEFATWETVVAAKTTKGRGVRMVEENQWVNSRYVVAFEDVASMERFMRLVHQREVEVDLLLGKGKKKLLMRCERLTV